MLAAEPAESGSPKVTPVDSMIADVLFATDEADSTSPRDPLDEKSFDAEASQEMYYEEGEHLFDCCDKNGDGALTKSEIKKFSQSEAGKSMKAVLSKAAGGWASLWEKIEVNDDGTFSKESFSAAYAALAFACASDEVTETSAEV